MLCDASKLQISFDPHHSFTRLSLSSAVQRRQLMVLRSLSQGGRTKGREESVMNTSAEISKKNETVPGLPGILSEDSLSGMYIHAFYPTCEVLASLERLIVMQVCEVAYKDNEPDEPLSTTNWLPRPH